MAGVCFRRCLSWLFSSANLIPHCSYNCYTQPFFLSVYVPLQILCYKTQHPPSVICAVFWIFIKSKPTIFIFFSYLIILFARKHSKKETKHEYYFVRGRKPQNWIITRLDLANNICMENMQLCTATLMQKRIHTKRYSCRRIQTI